MGFLRRHAPLLLILAAAAVLRLHALSDLPPAHYRDVALTATDALRAASGHPRLHFTYDEGLYADLMGLVFALLGPSDFTVRLPGALFGVLTCWGVFRLGRALGRERAGLWAAGFMAVSFWHVLLSRSGFRAVLLACLLSHSAAFLIEGLRAGGGRRRLLLGGALLGAGAHVYPAVRFAPLFFAGFLAAEIGASRDRRRGTAGKAALFAVAAFAVALPMLLHYVRHPEQFTYPRRVLSVFSPKVPTSEVPAHLVRNVGATLLMFHVRGDTNNRHNLSGAPMLDPLTGLLLLGGAAVAWRRLPRAHAILLLGWFAVMLLPNVLSVEGVPHGLRSSGALPAAMLLAGIGLDSLVDLATRRVGRRAAVAAGVSAIAAIGCFTAYRYFGVWGHDERVALDHDAPYRAAARLLLAAPADTDLFLIANGQGFPAYGHPVEAQPYLFELRRRPPVIIGPKDARRLVLQHGRKALVAVIVRDERIVEILRGLNPGATIVEVQGRGLSARSPVYRVD